VQADPTLASLRERLRDFAAARDWDQFHSPKNLAIALVAEAGELVEHFRWLSEAQSAALAPEVRAQVEEEIADVLIFLVRLCDKLDVDPLAAAAAKIEINERRYPVGKAHGNARKHDRL
jgi:NTP pyrophosphatase (non-canonical NTP hydrolase)